MPLATPPFLGTLFVLACGDPRAAGYGGLPGVRLGLIDFKQPSIASPALGRKNLVRGAGASRVHLRLGLKIFLDCLRDKMLEGVREAMVYFRDETDQDVLPSCLQATEWKRMNPSCPLTF